MKDRVRARWEAAILVCRKCDRKLDGFGPGHQPLAKALRRATGGGKGRKARLGIVEVGCLGVCPKRAVMVVDARRPDAWLIVPADAVIEAVAARLGLAEQA